MVTMKMGTMERGSKCCICHIDLSNKAGVRLGDKDYCFDHMDDKAISEYTKGSKVEKKDKSPYRLRYRNYGGDRFEVLAKVNIETNTIKDIFKCKCGNILLEKKTKKIAHQNEDDTFHKCIGCNKIYP